MLDFEAQLGLMEHVQFRCKIWWLGFSCSENLNFFKKSFFSNLFRKNLVQRNSVSIRCPPHPVGFGVATRQLFFSEMKRIKLKKNTTAENLAPVSIPRATGGFGGSWRRRNERHAPATFEFGGVTPTLFFLPSFNIMIHRLDRSLGLLLQDARTRSS